MTPERRAAQRKQIIRGNAPRQTTLNIEEVRADVGYYLIGLYYRKRLNKKLKRGEASK